jgi:hypothetical protein
VACFHRVVECRLSTINDSDYKRVFSSDKTNVWQEVMGDLIVSNKGTHSLA